MSLKRQRQREGEWSPW